MTFTDDDLAELKELITASIYWSPKIPALIARLEAAEDAVHQAYRCTADNKEYYNKWREIAGQK